MTIPAGGGALGGAADPAVAGVRQAVADAHRREWARVLAATVRVARDLDLAEECVQDAYVAALDAWLRQGVPDNPGAWLTTTAQRRALNAHKRASILRAKLPLLIVPDPPPPAFPSAALSFTSSSSSSSSSSSASSSSSSSSASSSASSASSSSPPSSSSPSSSSSSASDISDFSDEADFPDDRLRLVFTCCHPALAREAQLALTLRLVCGLTTAEIARAFLVSEPTMAARVTRAKKKIAVARIPYRVPSAEELPDRLDAVLTVVHLVFTTGHAAPGGDALVRHDLVDRALDLARMLCALMPDEREALGLLAMMLLHDARRATRVSGDGGGGGGGDGGGGGGGGGGGRLLRLEEQDRSRWDTALIADGLRLVRAALRGGKPGRFALQATISALYTEAPTYADTDWGQLRDIYDLLLAAWPSPVVALNRAVVVSMLPPPTGGPAAALVLVDALAGDARLAAYHYLPATRADLLQRLDRPGEAAAAYRQAIALCDNAVERSFLEHRLASLT